MASLIRSSDGSCRIQFVTYGADGRRKRKTLRPGRMPRKDAEKIKTHVEALVSAALCNSSPDNHTAAWLGGIGVQLHRKLVKVGLVGPRTDYAADVPAPPVMTVAAFVDDYLRKREGTVKFRTMNGAQQDRDSLVTFLGVDRPLASVTKGDAKDFVTWLRREGRRGRTRNKTAPRPAAEATIGRRVRRCSEFFADAVDRGLIAKNPFAGVKAPPQENKARFFFVSRDATARMIEAAPDAQWRLIVALARYGGLRTPSETLALTWADVDWERARIRVRSPKTEHIEGKAERIIPLFPELRPHLQAAWDALGDEPGHYVITRYRDGSVNLRTNLQRIIRRAGLTPWPRLFHNLRASRQNELAATVPVHVCCAWIGNSALIAGKHYLEVTEDYFEMAQKAAHAGTSSDAQETAGASNPSELLAPACSSALGRSTSYPGQERNARISQAENTSSGIMAHDPTHGPDSRLAAIVDAWDELPDAGRDEVARLFAAHLDLARRVADRLGRG